MTYPHLLSPVTIGDLELRNRVVQSLIVVLLMFGVCFYFAPDLMRFLALPLNDALPPGSKAVFIAGEGAFFTLTKIAFLAAILFSLPWVLYQAWAFVAPGLYEHEKKLALPLVGDLLGRHGALACPRARPRDRRRHPRRVARGRARLRRPRGGPLGLRNLPHVAAAGAPGVGARARRGAEGGPCLAPSSTPCCASFLGWSGASSSRSSARRAAARRRRCG